MLESSEIWGSYGLIYTCTCCRSVCRVAALPGVLRDPVLITLSLTLSLSLSLSLSASFPFLTCAGPLEIIFLKICSDVDVTAKILIFQEIQVVICLNSTTPDRVTATIFHLPVFVFKWSFCFQFPVIPIYCTNRYGRHCSINNRNPSTILWANYRHEMKILISNY